MNPLGNTLYRTYEQETPPTQIQRQEYLACLFFYPGLLSDPLFFLIHIIVKPSLFLTVSFIYGYTKTIYYLFIY
jgi:hypothetical protein